MISFAERRPRGSAEQRQIVPPPQPHAVACALTALHGRSVWVSQTQPA